LTVLNLLVITDVSALMEAYVYNAVSHITAKNMTDFAHDAVFMYLFIYLFCTLCPVVSSSSSSSSS
jgi:hypothetical protein